MRARVPSPSCSTPPCSCSTPTKLCCAPAPFLSSPAERHPAQSCAPPHLLPGPAPPSRRTPPHRAGSSSQGRTTRSFPHWAAGYDPPTQGAGRHPVHELSWIVGSCSCSSSWYMPYHLFSESCVLQTNLLVILWIIPEKYLLQDHLV
jgi:hypothetical protein